MDEVERLQRRLGQEREARKQAEAIAETKSREVTVARQKLADAIDSIHEGFVLFDPDDRLELCNKRYTDLLYPGLRDEMVPGRTYEEILRIAATRGLIWDAKGQIDDWVAERVAEHQRASGSRIQPWSNGRWLLITERRRADGGIVAVYTDVTELKQAENALSESEERYALAMAGANEGMWDWHTASDNIYVSESFKRLVGLETGSSYFTQSDWRAIVHPDDVARREEALNRHRQGYTAFYDCEYRLRHADGTFRWFHDRARSIRDESGDISRMAGSLSDITARKESEQAVLQAKQKAEEANARVLEQNQMLEALSHKLSKYLSPQIYKSIFSGAQSVEISSKRKKLTIFFSDIAGFTTLTDQLESEELTNLLNNYLTEMSNIAHEYGATIDKYVGDAIIAFFGDPDSKGVKEDAIACVNMAIAMQRRMQELRSHWGDVGLERPFELRIGINTGYCTVGNFGSDDRMSYTIIGNEVNLTARLESAADVNGILIAYETNSLVKDVIHTEEQAPLQVKGFKEPVRTYRVVGMYDDLADSGRIFRHQQQGIDVFADFESLNDKEKNAAIAALRQLINRIDSL